MFMVTVRLQRTLSNGDDNLHKVLGTVTFSKKVHFAANDACEGALRNAICEGGLWERGCPHYGMLLGSK